MYKGQKKSKVWDWTEDGCRNQLKIHLMLCGKHQLLEEEAIAVAEEPSVETEVWQPPPAAPPAKKQRPGLQQQAIGRGQLAIPGSSTSSSSGGYVSIKKEHLSSAFWPSNDFAH